MSSDSSQSHDALADYARVSTDEQREQQTIETQRRALDRYCAAYEITPVGHFQDDGISGTVPFAQRPAGARLLTEVAAGRVRTVLVWRLDRVGRNAREVLNAIHALEAAGARLISVTESFDTSTPAGRLQLNMLASIAEFERDSIIQRSDEGMARRLTDTTWMGGRAPYGLRIEGKRRTARLVLSDEPDAVSGYSEVETVKLMWELAVAQGWSCEQVAAHLDQLHIPPREGMIWQPGAVYRILTNASVAGMRTYRGKDGTRHTHACPAILTPAALEQARTALRDHRRYSAVRAEEDVYLLRGLLVCGECGQPYTTSWSRRTSGPHCGDLWRYYACSTRHYRTHTIRRRRLALGLLPQECHAASLDAAELEDAIWRDVEGFIRDPGTALVGLSTRRADDAAGAEAHRVALERAQRARAGMQGERDSVLALYRKGRVSEHDLNRQLDDIAREEAQHTAAEAAAQAALSESSETVDRLERARLLLQGLHARLEAESDAATPSLALRREAMRALIEQITVETVSAGTSVRGRPKYEARARVRYTFDRPAADATVTSPATAPLHHSDVRDSEWR